jgi:hypothetical protein
MILLFMLLINWDDRCVTSPILLLVQMQVSPTFCPDCPQTMILPSGWDYSHESLCPSWILFSNFPIDLQKLLPYLEGLLDLGAGGQSPLSKESALPGCSVLTQLHGTA